MSYYDRKEHETQDPKGLAARKAKGSLQSFILERKTQIKMWKKEPKEHLKQIEDAQEDIAKAEKELADYPEEPRELSVKRIGLQKLKERLVNPQKALEQDLSTEREDKESSAEDSAEGVEDQSAILNDILLELRKLSNRIEVIIHLIQIDRIYKTPDKRREAQKLLMRKVRKKERAEQ